MRSGRYVNFGYLHLITHADGNGVPSTSASKRFVDWVTGNTSATGTPAPFNIFDITIKAKLIPNCAMKVMRTSEGGAILLVDSKKRGNLRRVRGAALRPAHEPYEDQLAFLARRAFLSVSASRRR
ncbi:MAG TPA: hypothetical protein VN253_13185, partial [Kofleriaceae bacterium]|nr:hypothetical protein [Kofleriaceae bacterium]